MSKRRQKARPCPTATKTAYADRVAAELALAYVQRRDDAWREKLPVRAYRCPCGRWHLTSEEKRPRPAALGE